MWGNTVNIETHDSLEKENRLTAGQWSRNHSRLNGGQTLTIYCQLPPNIHITGMIQIQLAKIQMHCIDHAKLMNLLCLYTAGSPDQCKYAIK